MADSPVAALRQEYDAIARQLAGAPGAAEREAAKREIIAYFKKVEAMLAELSHLKEDIRRLVDRFTGDTNRIRFNGGAPLDVRLRLPTERRNGIKADTGIFA